MQITSISTVKDHKAADVVVVPVWHDEKKPELAAGDKGLESAARFPLQSGDFNGKEGETLLLYLHQGKGKRALLVGIGGKKRCCPEVLRRSYASAVKAIRARKYKSAHFLLPATDAIARDRVLCAVAEGVLLANYSFDHKEKSIPALAKICLCGLSRAEHALLKRTERLVDAVDFARDLTNANADEATVEAFKKSAKQIAGEFSHVKTTILDKRALEKEKMGLLLAVGRASLFDPALILVEYKGNPQSKEKIAVVGKGITFDTGGLNIKVSGMETMRGDMAGAAAALGTLRAAADLKLKVNLIAVLAVAENAVGPASFKPGDVYRGHSGATVEIGNTDAEGRLVLADAISYVEKNYAPTRIIDLATLTGGVVIALGDEATGLFSNDDVLAKAIEEAGERTHERVWRMPLYPEYKDYLKSTIADIKNIGPRKASAGLGATFIQHFVKRVPWAHLDIAGTAFHSELPYHPAPATGVGVRLLIDFLGHLDGKGE